MSEKDKLKTADVASFAARPGRTKAQAGSRFTHWREAGVIPTDEQVWGPGGHAYVYDQSTGAIFAVMCDLFDAGIVTGKLQLRGMWDYMAQPHADGCHPHITHILDAIAKGEACWLILTLWRAAAAGEFKTTCCTRFEDQGDKPIEAPTADHEPVGEYIVSLHKLLERFASTESNVRPIRAEG